MKAPTQHIDIPKIRPKISRDLGKHAGKTAANLLGRYYLVGAWILMSGVFGILEPNTFVSQGNFISIVGSQSTVVFLALSLLLPLVAGDLDLSIASNLGLSATIIAVLNGQHHVPVMAALLVAVVVGAGVGAINGVLVVYLGVDAIVVTLGMATLLLGIAEWISGSATVGGISQSLVTAVTRPIHTIPIAFFYGIVVAVVLWYVLDFTPLGRRVRFVGQNREVARLTGIPVAHVRVGAFVTAGVIAALGGIVTVGTLGAFQATVSPSYLLPAFAAGYLGSTVVSPGRFNAWGVLIAIYFLITGINGLQLRGLNTWVTDVFYGGALVVAVAVSSVVRRRGA